MPKFAPPKYIHLRSARFPVMPDEVETSMNPGTCGQSLAEYVHQNLRTMGWDSASFCGEDWGWWVDLRVRGESLGICCRRGGEAPGMCDLVCYISPVVARRWSWWRFRFVDITDDLHRLQRDLEQMFQADPEVTYVGTFDESPLKAGE